MLELFINYDMASDRIDLFQKLLGTLTSIAQVCARCFVCRRENAGRRLRL
jgi:hypothetical protein